MSTLDIILFLVAVIGVIAFGIWQSRDENPSSEQGAQDYFLAGRGLTWWLVGFSLIAANISTEQFVGMSGKAADWLGMAIASYEWMAAITLVVVAFVFLPKLLRCGIYTIPEFLEYRYGKVSRTIMALATMVILVGVPTASVIFSGAKVVSVFFQGTNVFGLDLGDVTVGCWIIAISAAAYVFVGGLKACAWTDLIWGSALIIGGAVVMYLAFARLGEMPPEELYATKAVTSSATVEQIRDAGAFERFKLLNEGPAAEGPNQSGGKLHMVRPISDPEIPWTVLILGLWIPNFFYWGLNQYIMQRTLGSKSLAEGQKGLVFAAALKLIIPFVVVIPGILAFNLFSKDLKMEADKRNTPIVQEFESAPNKVFAVSESFADLNPELTRRMIAHNASKTGAVVEVPTTGAGAELFAVNQLALSGPNAASVPNASRLVGYDYDAAFGTLLRNLLTPGITWFVLAAIFGAVVSSLASMLNSASTIATMDITNELFRKSSGRDMSQSALVTSGRVFVVIFVLIATVIAPQLGRPEFGGIFTFIQEFQGFISPGVLAVFLFGFLSPKSPRYLGWLGIILNVFLYGFLKWGGADLLTSNGLWFAPEVSFLDRMGICFLVVLAVCAILTALNPLSKPVEMPVNDQIELKSSKTAMFGGIGVCILTVLLYIVFW